ncbi:MAG: hypothetical protein FWH24_00705 [Oscillospiraceae bacterium]|nr:hypothetical protein [Oscillospiraceae bacterium]
MNCFYHNTIPAGAQCRGECGKYLCVNCYNENNGYCPDCIERFEYIHDVGIEEKRRIAIFDIILGGVLFFFVSLFILVGIFWLGSELVILGLVILFIGGTILNFIIFAREGTPSFLLAFLLCIVAPTTAIITGFITLYRNRRI